MNSPLSKKEIEEIVLKSYLKLSRENFKIKPFESPDFILINDLNEIIGLEVTEFYQDYSEDGSEVMKRTKYIDRLHQKLRRLIINNFPKGYYFNVEYRYSENLNIDNEVNEINSIILNLNDQKKINNPSSSIKSLRIKYNPDISFTRVVLSSRSNYQETSINSIEEIVKKKAKVANKWFLKYPENWLLIVSGLSRASDLNIKELKDLESIDKHGWNKIILFDIFSSSFTKL